jgi:hypothetical protein
MIAGTATQCRGYYQPRVQGLHRGNTTTTERAQGLRRLTDHQHVRQIAGTLQRPSRHYNMGLRKPLPELPQQPAEQHVVPTEGNLTTIWVSGSPYQNYHNNRQSNTSYPLRATSECHATTTYRNPRSGRQFAHAALCMSTPMRGATTAAPNPIRLAGVAGSHTTS